MRKYSITSLNIDAILTFDVCRYDYIKPNCSRKDGTIGVDYFNGPAMLMEYVRSNASLRSRLGIRKVVSAESTVPVLGSELCFFRLFNYAF